MPLNFAAETEVTWARSRNEIEAMLDKAGATKFGFVVVGEITTLAFEHAGLRYRFQVRYPGALDDYVRTMPSGRPRPGDKVPTAQAQLYRIRWRSLALSVKARLAEVESGLTDLQGAFLPYLLLPNGETVAEQTRGPIALAYRGREVPLLPGA